MRFGQSLSKLAITLLTAFSNPVYAQQKDLTQSIRTKVNTPEEQLAGFKLAPGFVIELVASEADGIVNPIDLTFDDAGRLWTQTARMYPLDPIADIQWNDLLRLMDNQEEQKNHPSFKRILDLYQGKTKGTDQILVISNLYEKKPVKVAVWADGLTIPMSILPYKSGAYVAQGSETFFLDDTDHDGKADRRVPYLTGFGFTDTHTMSHSLVRGPGNWIHFSHGALNKGEVTALQSGSKARIDFSKIARFSLDGKRIELVNAGLNNIWGFQLRHHGQWYGSEANDLGYSVVQLESTAALPGIGNERFRSYQPFLPPLHSFRVGGTGLSGMAFADDRSGSFPEEYKDVAFLANPITSSINAIKMVRNEDGSISSSHLPDLLTSQDDWFRPVNMEFGPDGCLYIADWYNKIISHNELPTTHPDRDKSHGRIWRIRHSSQQPRPVPDFYQMRTQELPVYLKSPSLWEKRAAWHQISDRPRAEITALTPQIKAIAADSQSDISSRIHALWALESIHEYDQSLMESLVHSPASDIRREVVRSLSSFELTATQVLPLLSSLIDDPNPAVRAQALSTLTALPTPSSKVIELLVQSCQPELPGHDMGGSYERKFERYLARKALEQWPEELLSYLNSTANTQIPALNALWAVQALPSHQRAEYFLKFWPSAHVTTLDESTFISIVHMLDHPDMPNLLHPFMTDPQHGNKYLRLALQNQSQLSSPTFAQFLEQPVQSLVNSNRIEEKELALQLIKAFKIQKMSEPIRSTIDHQLPERTLQLALNALAVQSDDNKDILMKLAYDKNVSFPIRLLSLKNLSQLDFTSARTATSRLVSTLTSQEKEELINVLSTTVNGADIITRLYNQNALESTSISIPAAERITNANKQDQSRQTLLKQVQAREEERNKAVKNRIDYAIAVSKKVKGNPESGKLLFQTCLSCHQVGDKGQNLGPALDGSANRESEALLTAIVDPDAAVESSYLVYRIYKKDGSTLEGLLIDKNSKGTTLAFMGGSKVFIDVADIKSQHFIPGRSFMVKGLIDSYTDTQVADLLSYIKTLK